MLPQITVTKMAPTKYHLDATNLRNTIINVHLNKLKLRNVSFRYGISSLCIQRALKALQVHHYLCSKQNLPKIIKENNHLQGSHWTTNFIQDPTKYS